MKKFSILTTVAALGLAGSMSFPSQAAGLISSKDNVVSDNCVVIDCPGTDPSEIEAAINQILEDIKCNNLAGCKVITIPLICKPGTDSNRPGGDDSNAGTDTNQPEGDDSNAGTDTNQPEEDDSNTGTDTNQPEEDDSNAGTDTNQPEEDDSNAGTDTNQPEVDGSQPGVDSDQPETDNDYVDTVESSFAEQVVALVNEERAKAGLNPVTLDKNIEAAALIRAKEIEVLFSHTRPDGSSFISVLKEQGIEYRGAGENIAWGQLTPEQVMNAWMNSSGHRANILNPNYTKLGVGYYQNAAGRNFWTQLFVY